MSLKQEQSIQIQMIIQLCFSYWINFRKNQKNLIAYHYRLPRVFQKDCHQEIMNFQKHCCLFIIYYPEIRKFLQTNQYATVEEPYSKNADTIFCEDRMNNLNFNYPIFTILDYFGMVSLFWPTLTSHYWESYFCYCYCFQSYFANSDLESQRFTAPTFVLYHKTSGPLDFNYSQRYLRTNLTLF